jgi:hypothetical protein
MIELLSTIFVGFNVEPVLVLILVHLNVLDEKHLLLLESFDPSLAVFGTSISFNEGKFFEGVGY